MLLELNQVSYQYPEGFRLQDISWQVAEGAFCALIGPNGCGKSTLVRVISGYLPRDGGSIELLRQPIESYTGRQLARRLAVIPSENHFEFPFRVGDVVGMGRFPYVGRLDSLTPKDQAAITQAMQVTETDAFRDRAITELSSGERQRVLLARALAQEPRLLILDEPTAHLDIHHQIAVFRLLRQQVKDGRMSVIVVLHDLTMAGVFCDRVALLHRGRLLHEGAPDQVITTDIVRQVYGADVEIIRTESGTPLIAYEAGDPRGS